MAVLARRCALVLLVLTSAASAQTSTLEPFNYNASYSVGGNGVTRPIYNNKSYQHLSLYPQNNPLTYESYTRTYASDFSSGTFSALAQRVTSGGSLIRYVPQWYAYYQQATRYYQRQEPEVLAPTTGDLNVALGQTDLCSVRMNVVHRCAQPTLMYYYLNPNDNGPFVQGWFYAGPDATAAVAPDQAIGFVSGPHPTLQGYQIATAETLYSKGRSAYVPDGYIDFEGHRRVSLAGRSVITPSPAAGQACTADITYMMPDELCLPPATYSPAEVHGTLDITPTSASCDFVSLQGCPTLEQGYPQFQGYRSGDGAYIGHATWQAATASGIIDYTGANAIPWYAGVYTFQESQIQWRYPNQNYSSLTLPWVQQQAPDGGVTSSEPRATGWAPAIQVDADGGVDGGSTGSDGGVRQGFWPDGRYFMLPDSQNEASFTGAAALVNARVIPNGCLTTSDLTTDSYFQIYGRGDVQYGAFTAPDGANTYRLTNLYGARAYQYMAAVAPGLFQVMGLAGPWDDGYFHLAFHRETPSYVHENFSYLLHNLIQLRNDVAFNEPDRNIPLGKLNIRMYVKNAAGSGPRLRPFRAPFSEYGYLQKADGSSNIADNIHSYGKDETLTEHVVAVIAPPGKFVAQNLGAYVPLNPDGSGEETRTPFPSIPPVDLLPPTADGQCQAVCIDANTGLAYPDDEKPPAFTITIAPPAVTHTNPVSFSGTATDLTPIDILINDDPKTTVGGAGATANWTASARLHVGINNVTVSAIDKCGSATTQSFTIEMTNIKPIVSVPSITRHATQTISLQVSATDGDGDTLVYSVNTSSLPAGSVTTMNAATGAFTWNTGFGSLGTYDLPFTVDDGIETVTVSSHIVVNNTPPTLAPIADTLANETDTITIANIGADADGDALTYSFVATDLPLGANVTCNTATGAFTWVTDYTSEGTYDVHFSVTDQMATTTRIAHIVVAHKNQPPIFDNLAEYTIYEKDLLSFTVHASDGDNDVLVYAATSQPAGSTFNALTQQFSWTPDYGAAPGPYLAIFTANDGQATTTFTVTIHVLHRNRPPAVGKFEQTMYETDDLTFALPVSDPDVPVFDTLTISAGGKGLPSFASLDSPGKTTRWRPPYASAGDYEVLFLVSDGHVTVELPGIVHVLHKNRPPVIDPIADHTIPENTSVAFVVTGRDPDPADTLTFSLQSATTANVAWSPALQTFKFSPDRFQRGLHTFTFSLTDGVATVSATTHVLVTYTNAAPLIALVPDRTIYEKDLLSVTVTATDPDGDPLSFFAIGALPAGASFDTETHRLTWTPDYGQAGTYPVAFGVSDGKLSTATTARIFVLRRNRPPVFDPALMATLQLRQIQEGSPLVFTLLATDPDVGDIVTYGLQGTLPAGAQFDAATGVFSWTPAFGQARPQTYDVAFTASDGQATTPGLAKILVLHTNRAPVWDATTVVNRAGTEGIALSFVVLANDPDAGDTLTYSAAGLPTGATFNTATRTLSWTPAAGQAGNHRVTFNVTDGLASAAAPVLISIGRGNRPPAFDPIAAQTVREGQRLTFTVSASDPDGDAVTFGATGLPTGATFDPVLRLFSWVPAYGTASTNPAIATFTASDGKLTAAAAASITVTHANRPPSLRILGELRTTEERELVLTLVGTDPDGDALTYTAANLPAGATLDAATRIVRWTPTRGQAGSYKPTFTVSDGALSDATSPQITVDRGNRAPFIDPIPDQTVAEGRTLTFTITGHDPDGDVVAYGAPDLPEGAVFDPGTRTVRWTPRIGQAGVFSARFSATDGALWGFGPAKITVMKGNLPPVIDPQGPYEIKEGSDVGFNVTATDPEGQPVTCNATPLPAGSVWDAGTKSFQWTTGAGSAGSYTVPVTCTDGLLSASASVIVRVIPNKLRIEGAGVGCSSSGPSASWLAFLPLLALLRRRKRAALASVAAIAAAFSTACAKGSITAQPGGDTGALIGRVIVGAETDRSNVAVSLQGPTGASALTASDGSFSFTGLRPGSYAVLLTAARTAEGTIAALATVESGRTAKIDDQAFVPLGDVVGRVQLGSNEVGNGGATVVAVGGSARAVTDDAGRFTLRDVPAGDWQIAASMPGRASATRTVTVGWAKTSTLTTALALATSTATGAVSGKALLAGLQNHRGITVSLSGATAQGTISDAEGSYTFGGVPDGTYFVTASAAFTVEGALQASAVVVTGGAATVRDLVLSPLGQLEGVATLGAAAGNAGILVFAAGTSALGITDDAGKFRLGRVPAGPQAIFATFPGYSSASVQQIEVHYAQSVTLPALTLSRSVSTGSLAGRAFLLGEASHAGISVRLLGPASAATITDATGAYSFGSLPDGAYTLVAQAASTMEGSISGTAAVNGGAAATSGDLTLHPLGLVAGFATLGAGGTANQGISVSAAATEALTTTADANGSFLLQRVPTGARTVVAAAPGWKAASAAATVRYNAVTSLAATLVLQKPVAAGSVFGRALLAGQTVHAGITLTLAGPAAATFVTGSTGDYAFVSLPDGSYTVTASAPSTAEGVVTGTVSVTSGGAAHLVLPLLTPVGALVGTVVYEVEEGLPRQGIAIAIPGTDAVTTTDATGRFHLGGIPAGAWDVHASAAGFDDAAVLSPVIWRQTRELPAVLVLRRHLASGVISGGLTMRGAPADGITVDAIGPTPATAVTAIGGGFTFTGLADGQYGVTALDSCSLEVESTQQVTLLRGTPTVPVALFLTAAGNLIGRVTHAADGSAAAGLSIALSTGLHALTNSDGFYRFDRLAAGSYGVQAVGASGPSSGGAGDVVRCQTARIDLSLAADALGSFSTVVHAVGSPPSSGIAVAVRGGDVIAHAQTATDGTFLVRDLPAGLFSMSFDGPSGAHETLPAVVSAGSAIGVVLDRKPFALAPLELQRGRRVHSALEVSYAAASPATGSIAVLSESSGPPGYYSYSGIGVPCSMMLDFYGSLDCNGALDVIAADGSVRRIAPDAARPGVRFSPSGRSLLYVTGSANRGNTMLKLAALDGRPLPALKPVRFYPAYLSFARFAVRDGAERMLSGFTSEQDGSLRLGEANLETGDAMRISTSSLYLQSPRYAAGGTRAVFLDGSSRVHVAATDGSFDAIVSPSYVDTWYPGDCDNRDYGCVEFFYEAADGKAIIFRYQGGLNVVGLDGNSKAKFLGQVTALLPSGDRTAIFLQDPSTGRVSVAPFAADATPTVLAESGAPYSLVLSTDGSHAAWSTADRQSFCTASAADQAPSCLKTGFQKGESAYLSWVSPTRLTLEGSAIAVWNVGDAQATIVSGDSVSYGVYAHSPDGEAVVFAAQMPDGPPTLRVVSLSTGATGDLGQSVNRLQECRFSPEGSGILCAFYGGSTDGEKEGGGRTVTGNPLLAFETALCLTGSCSPFLTTRAVEYDWVAGPPGRATLLWTEDLVVPDRSNPYSSLHASGADGSGAVLLGTGVPYPALISGSRRREGGGGSDRYLPFVSRLSPDGKRLLFHSLVEGGVRYDYQNPVASRVQLNVVDLDTYESLRAPTALVGLGAEGHWLTPTRAFATKRASVPYQIQDGVYIEDFQ